jgi:hypothetical protein
MIKINVSQQDTSIDSISIKGHADYAEKGKDIVCASVSSIVITSVNAIIRLDSESISYQESDGLIKINVLKQNEVVNILLTNMIDLLENLEQQYKKNIKINK